MNKEPYYVKAEREAAEKLSELLSLPIDEDNDMNDDERFDPWKLFPLYGTYSGDFDKCAIEVLTEIRDRVYKRDDLAAHMFREMLCTADLCDYGTSPRVCFANQKFQELLPELIEKWKAFSLVQWGEDVCA